MGKDELIHILLRSYYFLKTGILLTPPYAERISFVFEGSLLLVCLSRRG